MHYENENCDTDDLNRGIDDLDGIPAALLQQFYYNGRWHDKLTRRVAKRRAYIQCRWKITEADGSIRYTDATVWTVYSTPRWYDRIIAYFRMKREQRRQSKTKRG